MSNYVLTTEAQLSLKSIKKYSLENFGEKSTLLYLGSLHNRMKILAKSPKMGVERCDLFKAWSCYSYFEGSHTIYYEIKEMEIVIIDILHQRMEAKLHLLDR